MRCIVTTILILILISISAVAQSDSVSLKKAIVSFNTALIHKDSATLKKLVHDKITYGHSNGWLQSKKDVINDLYTGKIVYNVIEQEIESLAIDGSTASVRETANINVEMNGKPLQLKLKILQVWVYKKKEWQLFSRQSVKM